MANFKIILRALALIAFAAPPGSVQAQSFGADFCAKLKQVVAASPNRFAGLGGEAGESGLKRDGMIGTGRVRLFDSAECTVNGLPRNSETSYNCWITPAVNWTRVSGLQASAVAAARTCLGSAIASAQNFPARPHAGIDGRGRGLNSRDELTLRNGEKISVTARERSILSDAESHFSVSIETKSRALAQPAVASQGGPVSALCNEAKALIDMRAIVASARSDRFASLVDQASPVTRGPSGGVAASKPLIGGKAACVINLPNGPNQEASLGCPMQEKSSESSAQTFKLFVETAKSCFGKNPRQQIGGANQSMSNAVFELDGKVTVVVMRAPSRVDFVVGVKP